MRTPQRRFFREFVAERTKVSAQIAEPILKTLCECYIWSTMMYVKSSNQPSPVQPNSKPIRVRTGVL
jgi:hypothetical protein